MSKYDDIINLKRPVSRRMPMSITNRAAQFAPFSALTGYDEAIKETSRITSEKHELSDCKIEIINKKLNEIKNNGIRRVKITYFVKDDKKDGGEYITEEVDIKKIDIYNEKLVCLKVSISFDDILEIDYV